MIIYICRYVGYFILGFIFGSFILITIMSLSFIFGNDTNIFNWKSQLIKETENLFSILNISIGKVSPYLIKPAIALQSNLTLLLNTLTDYVNKNGFVQFHVEGLRNYFGVLILAVKWIAIRCGWLILSIPLFISFGMIGAVDGWAIRARRRARGGRESVHRYQDAKKWAEISMVLGIAFFIAFPFNFSFCAMLWLIAFMFGCFIQRTVSFYKKYS